MCYTLDANILINMERLYPKEFFKSLWEKMESAAISKNVCLCYVIFTEIERGGPELSDWAKGIEGFICETTDDEANTAAKISQKHPAWVQGQKNSGDPFIIAHARHSNRIIVTEEKRTGPGTIDKNQRVPNIADEHDVECINFFEFMRRKEWTF
ncbi:DUF4411 family protein [Rothia dentocariosa]|uniref:DUF4411 family protein n=1 Tax=Rothia dentocariosa TaxID=2047 RepID=UPI0014559C6B|nr:DUF4411 family protein [Rothia dentocariosa]NLR25681.1 DUF4411 family protein [Rothia dentocariosa]